MLRQPRIVALDTPVSARNALYARNCDQPAAYKSDLKRLARKAEYRFSTHLPPTMELSRNPSAFAIATNSRIGSGSRLQFTLVIRSRGHAGCLVGSRPVNCQALLRGESPLAFVARVGRGRFHQCLRPAVGQMGNRCWSFIKTECGSAGRAAEHRLHLQEHAMEVWVGQQLAPNCSM